jgi:hypothetical protein
MKTEIWHGGITFRGFKGDEIPLRAREGWLSQIEEEKPPQTERD